MTSWILGGSSGLGAELVKEAGRRGINSVLLGRNADQRVDLSDPRSVGVLCNLIATAGREIMEEIDFFVWNAGELEYAPVEVMRNTARLFAVNAEGPTAIIRALIGRKKALGLPLHLVVISSVASWKARADMAVYAGLKAYQAQYARCLSLELERDLPGSKVTIACPAGMKTELFPSDIDTTQFMEPREVAAVIWGEVAVQEKACDWFNVLRDNGKPVVSRENFSPELAYDALLRHNRPSS